MAERTIPLPAHILRFLLAPATLGVLGALLGTVVARIRRRARQPTLPRMSEEWLRSHDVDAASSGDFWRDSW